jgi:hypothetical protein
MDYSALLRKNPWHATLTVLAVFNLVALGLVYQKLNTFGNKFPYELLQSNIQSQADILTKLGSVQNLLASGQSLDSTPNVMGMADLMPDKVNTNTPDTNNFIVVAKTQMESVPVYKEQAEFSAVLGRLVKDYHYPYFTKIEDWYLVSLENGQTGWVKSANVTVVQ